MKTVAQLIKEKLKEIKKQPKATGFYVITIDTELEDSTYSISEVVVIIDKLNRQIISTRYYGGNFEAVKDYNNKLIVIDYEIEEN